MRLWHIDLIPYLPDLQIKAQWRELNSIFKNQNKHILINYVYSDKADLYDYSKNIIAEMQKRGFKIKSFENFENYFGVSHLHKFSAETYNTHFAEHNDEYLTICYWNLREKYLRGQKDFTDEVWQRIDKFYKEKTNVTN